MKLLLLAALALASLAQAQELTLQQQRGRAIYTEGAGSATVGGRVLPAKLFPCASCHGENGRGQREGGTGIADITPPVLARATTVGERSRPAYTPAMLRHAIAAGSDSAGQPLDRVMPRYQLKDRDAADLLAYLAILDNVSPIGVSADAVRINIIGAPGLAAPAEMIYGRRIVLQHDRAEGALLTIEAREQLELAESTLARIGRDFTRKEFLEAYERAGKR
jgi:mono/diheme cytochrome c family protein